MALIAIFGNIYVVLKAPARRQNVLPRRTASRSIVPKASHWRCEPDRIASAIADAATAVAERFVDEIVLETLATAPAFLRGTPGAGPRKRPIDATRDESRGTVDSSADIPRSPAGVLEDAADRSADASLALCPTSRLFQRAADFV